MSKEKIIKSKRCPNVRGFDWCLGRYILVSSNLKKQLETNWPVGFQFHFKLQEHDCWAKPHRGHDPHGTHGSHGPHGWQVSHGQPYFPASKVFCRLVLPCVNLHPSGLIIPKCNSGCSKDFDVHRPTTLGPSGCVNVQTLPAALARRCPMICCRRFIRLWQTRLALQNIPHFFCNPVCAAARPRNEKKKAQMVTGFPSRQNTPYSGTE